MKAARESLRIWSGELDHFPLFQGKPGEETLPAFLTFGAVEVADNTDRIAEIREVLRSGVKSSTIDGVSITHDFDVLRRELRELIADDDTLGGRRPAAYSFDLSGF